MIEETALLVAAHGSPSEPAAGRVALDHGETLRTLSRFASVRVALLHGGRSVAECVSAVEARRLVVVPLFVSDGYFAGEVLPDRVEAARPADLAVAYADPVGTHDLVTDAVWLRARSVVGEGPEVGLALLGHGSGRDDANADAVREHAARLRDRTAFGAVKSFFVEEPPFVDHAPAAFDVPTVVAVPLFVGEGEHVTEDVPAMLGLDAAGDERPDALDRAGAAGERPARGGRVVDGDRSDPLAPDSDRRPELLGWTGGQPTVLCTAPIGTHPSMPAVVRERATAAIEDAWGVGADTTPPGGTHRDATGRYPP